MEANDVIQLIVYIAVFLLLTPILGAFIASVLMGKKTFLTPILGWLEKAIYKFSGVNPSDEMNWKSYAKSLLVFNFLGFLFVFLLQLTQKYLPLNPQSLSNISWDQSFNTAVSFMTNTNWQSYGGEGALSYLTQMLGLTVQNFVSAATGIAVFAALEIGRAHV